MKFGVAARTSYFDSALILLCAFAFVALPGHTAMADSNVPPDPDWRPGFRVTQPEEVFVLCAQGKWDEAIEWASELLDRLKQSPMDTRIDYLEDMISRFEFIRRLPIAAQYELARADSLRLEARGAWNAGDYSKGAELERRRLDTLRLHFKDPSLVVARCLHNLAANLSHKGAYAQAEPLFRESLEMLTSVFGKAHVQLARTIEYLGEMYAAEGNYDQAEAYYTEALKLYPEVSSSNPAGMGLGRLWARLANLYIVQGEYSMATPLLRKGLATFRGRFTSSQRPKLGTQRFHGESWLTAMFLNDQAIVLWKQSDHAAAIPLFQEALTMRRNVLGDKHPHTIQSLNALGDVLVQSDEPAVAEPLLREALDRFQTIRDEEHPDISAALLSLATLKRSLGNCPAADSLARQALASCRRFRGEEHVDVAKCLHHLATTHMTQGRTQEAEAEFREAWMMYARSLGRKHPDTARSLHDYACCLLALGKPDEAEPLLSRAAESFETSRLRFEKGYARATFQSSPYSTLAATQLLLGNEKEAWPAAERAHGRVLADLLMSAGHRSLSEDERAVEDSLKRLLNRLDAEVAALHEVVRVDSTGQTAHELREASARLATAQAAWSAFQVEIASAHPVTEGRPFSLQQVQRSLTDHMALVGWLSIETNPGQSISWGYVIRTAGPVHWVRVDTESEPGYTRAGPEEVLLFRKALAGATSWLFRPTSVERINGDAANLWRWWMAPLTEYLKDVRHLIVIPSGPLMGVPIEVLVDNNDRYLCDRYTVSYTPSATVFSWLRESNLDRHGPVARNALLVGDPPFNPDHLAAINQGSTQKSAGEEPQLASGSQSLDASTLRSALAGREEALANLTRLPWTRHEVEQIASAVPRSTVLLGSDASEQQLISMAESGALREFDTIHLATHALVDDELPERSALILSRVDLPDPMDAIMSGSRIHDGLLTMKEIMREWDLDADLVTLSGCQTGLGRKAAGEGYIGLAHAFLQAGARSLLVSLWKVEEEATTLLMTRFYENLTGTYEDERADLYREPMEKAAALKEAKQWLRTYTDSEGNQPFRHPAYWSGFVLIGET